MLKVWCVLLVLLMHDSNTVCSSKIWRFDLNLHLLN
jgi:hypothetical protein